jgi:hypothetical protein
MVISSPSKYLLSCMVKSILEDWLAFFQIVYLVFIFWSVVCLFGCLMFVFWWISLNFWISPNFWIRPSNSAIRRDAATDTATLWTERNLVAVSVAPCSSVHNVTNCSLALQIAHIVFSAALTCNTRLTHPLVLGHLTNGTSRTKFATCSLMWSKCTI